MLAAGFSSSVELIFLITVILIVVGFIGGTVILLRTLGRIVGLVLRTAGWFLRLLLGAPHRAETRTGKNRRGHQPNRAIRRGQSVLVSPAMPRCPRPRCHAQNRPGANFCRQCGCQMDARPADRARVSETANTLTFARN